MSIRDTTLCKKQQISFNYTDNNNQINNQFLTQLHNTYITQIFINKCLFKLFQAPETFKNLKKIDSHDNLISRKT